MRVTVRRNAAAAAVALMASGVLCMVLKLFQPFALPAGPVDVDIRKGTGFNRAVNAFSGAGLVRDVFFFKTLGRVTGLHKRLIPGRYRFEGRVSQWDVYAALSDGDVAPYGITVLEGEGLYEIKDKLVSRELMAPEEFDRLSGDAKFLASLGIEAESLEGYLFPDTYSFFLGEEPGVILGAMVDRLRELYDEGLRKRTREMGWDVHKALTLASIIEREAVLDSERPLISAVYHNRLKKRMRLQADPTAIYGIKPLSAGVNGKDIKRRTPYNTYTFRGLPPGPIASPGINSIRAALYPADVPYLYFVSGGNGSHVFSRTHREHMRAVRKYRKNRKG